MKNAYKNFNNLDFVNFIQQYTGLDKFEMIYKAKDNRNIYHLYKT